MTLPFLLLLSRYQTHSDYDTICQDVGCFPALLALMLCLLQELSLDGFCTCNLGEGIESCTDSRVRRRESLPPANGEDIRRSLPPVVCIRWDCRFGHSTEIKLLESHVPWGCKVHHVPWQILASERSTLTVLIITRRKCLTYMTEAKETRLPCIQNLTRRQE